MVFDILYVYNNPNASVLIVRLFCAGWFAFIGRQVGLNVPGSPYAINFTSIVPEASGMSPMNISSYSCSDTSLSCSCGDCPLSPTCTSSAAPSISKSKTCSVKMGSVEVKLF